MTDDVSGQMRDERLPQRLPKTRKTSPVVREWADLVPHIGFEPMISALRGLCPGPLDECGIETAALRRAGRDNIRRQPGVPIRGFS